MAAIFSMEAEVCARRDALRVQSTATAGRRPSDDREIFAVARPRVEANTSVAFVSS